MRWNEVPGGVSAQDSLTACSGPCSRPSRRRPVGGLLHGVEDVVQRTGEAVDVLAVERCDEGFVDHHEAALVRSQPEGIGGLYPAVVGLLDAPPHTRGPDHADTAAPGIEPDERGTRAPIRQES
jgi:hypothetical protein